MHFVLLPIESIEQFCDRYHHRLRGMEAEAMSGKVLQKFILVCLLASAIFVLALITPRDVSVSTLYVIVVLASLWFSEKRIVYGALILCTVLTVAGFFFSPGSPELWKPIINRAFAITAFWIVGVVGLKRLQAEKVIRISNTELEQRVAERTESTQTTLHFTQSLYDVARAVISFEDLQDVLQSIVQTVAQTLSADRATVITFDHEARRDTHLVGAGPGANLVIHTISYAELMDGLSGWVLRELRPAFSTKAEPDPRESASVQHRRRETNCGCIVVFPLLYLGEVLGTMTVINTPEQLDFTEQEVSWMAMIADQAAAAIGRAQVYVQLKHANLLLEEQGERLQRELTVRKLAESALAFERDLLQALMDNIPDTIYFKDTDSRFTRVNQAQAEVLGVDTPEAAIGQTDADFQAPDLVEGFFEEEKQLIRSGEPLIDRVEYNPTREGKPRWFSATKVPIRNERGEVTGLVGISRDITDDKLKDQAMERQNEMLSRLHQITLDLLKYMEIDQLLNALANMVSEFLDAPFTEIILIEGDELVVHTATENLSHLIGEHVKRDEALLSWKAFDTRQPVVLADYSNWAHKRSVYDQTSLHASAELPILNAEQCLGVLSVGRNQLGYEFTTDQIRNGMLLANLTGLVLQNAKLREALREQSIHDPLTGLFNRRYMEETLEREVSRVTRQTHPLGIIMLDIDHFKSFNDTYGHAMGDAVLQGLGRFLQDHIRKEDIACRYGGEEFLLIMPDIALDIALERAERLCQNAHEIRVKDRDQIHSGITLSLGVAAYPQHGQTIESVLRATDAALYRAKQAGRNRVMVAENEA